MKLLSNGYLEYQGIKVKTVKGDLSVLKVNVYNQGCSVSRNELQFYVDQMGSQFVIMGDLNAYSKTLDSLCVRLNVGSGCDY